MSTGDSVSGSMAPEAVHGTRGLEIRDGMGLSDAAEKARSRTSVSNLQPHFRRLRLMCPNASRPFFRRNRCKKREARLARIYNHRARPLASRVVSQVANGCAAQDWRQLPTLRVKTCSHFTSFTISFRKVASRIYLQNRFLHRHFSGNAERLFWQ
jgi:hypothetical protein